MKEGRKTHGIGEERYEVPHDLKFNPDGFEGESERIWEHQGVKRSLGTLGATFNVIKTSMGSGILSMPASFKSGGLWTSLVCAILVGVLYAHCIHILVTSCRALRKRLKKPNLQYGEVAKGAFQTGPHSLRPYSSLAKNCVDGGLFVSLYLICAVYVVFIATSIKQMVELSFSVDMDLRLYMLFVAVLVVPTGMVLNLKYVVPFSFLSICALIFCLGYVLYDVFQALPPLSSRPAFTSFKRLPYFFSSMVYSIDGAGTLFPIENTMKNPQHFLGCCGVVNISVTFLLTLYCTMGFFGYLRYGEDTQGSISLNISSSVMGKTVKLLVSLNVLCSYCLFFYGAYEIFWRNLEPNVKQPRKTFCNFFWRVVLVLGTVLFAVFVPNLEAFVGFVGALCDSTVILFFPPVIELVTFWEDRVYMGAFRWRLVKDLLIIVAWLAILISGTENSVTKIVALYQ